MRGLKLFADLATTQTFEFNTTTQLFVFNTTT